MHTFLVSNRLGRWLAVAVLALLAAPMAQAQLSGAKAIPGDYASVAAAITALNAGGVGAGGVTFNIAAGYTETFASPTAGAITATGTAANPIVFQKSGSGANPVITAGATGTGTQDAVISLAGSDYVTFASIDVAENSANTTTATQMEFGYALFRASATDGCQNVSISGATITLNKTNTSTIGIWGANTLATATTLVTATSAAGANSSLKLNGNTVANAYLGIYLAGNTSTAANADAGNEIGTTAGNTLTGLGGSNTSVYGVRAEYQLNLKVENNTIAIPAGNTSSTVYGIGLGTGTATGITGTVLLNNNTVSITTATTSTVIGIFQGGSSGVTTSAITNNKVQNSTLTGASGSVFYIQDATTSAATSVTMTGNQVTGNSAATTGTVYCLYKTASGTTLTATGNTVSNNTKSGAGVLAGFFANITIPNLTVSTNTISGNQITAASGSLYGINLGSSATNSVLVMNGNTITNNTIPNTSGSTSSVNYGIYSFGAVSTSETETGNTITGLSISGTGTASATLLGLYLYNSATPKTISQNTIGNLTLGAAGTAVTGITSGIFLNTGTGSTVALSQNKVYGLSAYGTAGVVYGVYLLAATTPTITNNLIGTLTAPASTAAQAVTGLYIGGGTTVNAYYNTIYLAGTSSGSGFGSSGIYANTTPTLTLIDNIVVNNSAATGTGVAVAYRRSGTTLTTYAAASNNNLFYAGTPGTTQAIFTDGTNTYPTLAAYKTAMATRDQASVTELPPFASTTGTDATFLHIAAGSPTQVESGGIPVSGITTDYDGDTRNATTPDIGADEGSFSPATAITVTGTTYTQNNTPTGVGQTDQQVTGVVISTAGQLNPPVLNSITFNIGSTSLSNISNAKLYSSGSSTFSLASATLVPTTGSVASPSFTLTLTTPLALASGSNYYFLTYDIPASATPGATVASTATAVNVGGTTYTPTLSGPAGSRLIIGPLNGTYYITSTVGSSPDPTKEFASLTAAFAAYGTRSMSGPVSFVLRDATYSTGETFPLVLSANASASATNTLTIKPGTGVSSTISGSVATGAVLKLNGADYVTIDGSNAGTTSQNLTITNTSATGSGNAVLWLAAASATDGATNNVVKNTNITGSSSTGAPQFTVFLGGGGVGVAAPTTSTPAANSNNTFANNVITKGYYGVFVFGVSATVLDQNNAFTGNQIGQAATGTGFGQEGLRVVYQQGLNVTGNDIQNLTNGTTTSNLYGIFLADSKSSIISRNSVHGISYTGTSTTKVWAINTSITAFTTAANPSANRLDNNLVYGINSTAASSTWNTVGIDLGGGYGDQIVYNTVYLNGQLSAAGGTAGSAAFANGNPSNVTAATNIDVRNNIFSIIGGTGGTTTTPLYAHYEYGSTVTGSTLNFNDLYVTTGATGLAVIGHLGTSDYATLALWRTATSQEANSVSADPQFVQTTTTPYDLTPTATALNGAATPIVGVTVDYPGTTRGTTPDIGAYEFTPPACQAVSGLAFASITATSASVTFTAPTGGAGANSYTVTYTPAGGTATTITPNPTGSPVPLTGLTAATTYTVTVTTNCTGATSPSVTGTFRTACPPPAYATLPASEGFENTWLSRCDTREVPTANWLNTPLTGENSWRRDDDGTAANWTLPNGGAFTPAGQNSTHSARFHAYYAPSGSVGTLDFYVDLSATGTKRLSFGYVNQSTSGSKVDILLSTDGGATFSTTPLLTVTTSAAFSTKTLDLTATSATSVIRFKATSDYGSYDIGVDNVQVSVLPAIDLAATALATPTSTQGCYGSAETVAVTVTNQGTQTLDFGANPATVTATVTTPGGPQTLTGSITTGTLAAGATQNVTLTPTLNMTAVGTYTFAITATVTGDGNTANDALTPAPTRTVAAPVAGTLAPASSSICVSGTAALTLTGATNGSIQYQSSPDNVTFTDVAGATSATYTTPVLTSTTYYRAQVRCGTAVATSNVSTITVNNPLVASTNTPVAICSGSTATLTATAGTGSSVRFFDVATGGTALTTATAGSYTTPALTASATYYAEAYSGGTEATGMPAPNASDGSTIFTQSGVLFTVTASSVTLASTTIYPVGTGTVNIALYDNTGAQVTIGGVAQETGNINVTGSGVSTPVLVPLNFANIPAGSNYRLLVKAYSGITGLVRGTASASNYSTPSGSVTTVNGTLTPPGVSTSYYFFYNLQFNTECAGATRTAIQVNVTQPATASFAAATGSSCGTSAYQLAGSVGGSATGGTYTSSGTGTFSPNATTLTATYTPSAADVAAGSVTITLTSAGSTPCPAATATFALSISPAPTATFSYPAATTYCAGSASTVTPTLGAGATAGTFSSTTGLTINATTGVITLSNSTAGTYTVTNTVAASGTCAAVSATTTVTITPATTATFSYGGGTFCVSGSNPTATVTGTTGGTFSSTTGLTIDATTGAITLSSTTPGTYIVTYTVAGACGSSSTQSVTITTAPLATFSYGTSPTFCVSGTTNPAPSFGTGASGGVFSSTTGLTINATTGVITLASSTPGTYTVTNTIAANGGCAAASATASVTITAAPVATFSYGTTGTYCVSGTTNPAVVLGTGATAGTFSSTAGLTINATTGAITLSSSTPGTYTVTNTVAAANGCAATTATATVTITAAPVATFSYGTSATFCVSGTTTPAVVLGTGATAGTFTSTTGLTINATNGAITLSSSTPGTYTVTNTIAAASGCAAATATTQVTITAAPTAAFSYATATGCVGSTGTATPTLGTGATAGTFSSTTGLSINATTGVITLSSSTAGTYTVTNTVAAAGGCAAATATATFTVNPRPATPTISAAYNGATTTLTSSAATGNQFYFNGAAITGATGQTYVVNGTPASLGSYTVTTTNANGCVSLPSVQLVVTAAKTGLAGASLKLYPNPTPSGQVTLELTGYRSATQLTVLDALGRVVTQQLLPANAGTATHTLDLTGAATGVYLLRLSNADGVETRRLVRE